MPSRYLYRCTKCAYRAERYRNVRKCPKCRGDLVRARARPDRKKEKP